MTPLAIDQHQRLIRAQPAQGRRADHVGAIGDRRLREIEAGHQIAQQARGFGEAGSAELFGGNQIDRHRAVPNGAVSPARTGNDNRLPGVLNGGIGILREGGSSRHDEAGKQQSTNSHRDPCYKFLLRPIMHPQSSKWCNKNSLSLQTFAPCCQEVTVYSNF